MSYYNESNGSVIREWENKVPLDGYAHVCVQTVNHMAMENKDVFPNANQVVRSKSTRMVVGGYVVLSNGKTNMSIKPTALIENGYPEREGVYIYLVENLAKCFATSSRRLIDPYNVSRNRSFMEDARPYDRFSSTPASYFEYDIRFNHVTAGRDSAILNYTDEDIVVRDLDGFPRIYKPIIENDGHGLDGEIVLLESIFLDAPDKPGDTDTCYKHLASRYSEMSKVNPKYKVLEKTFIAANLTWNKFKKEEMEPAGVRITIATIIDPKEVKIIQSGAGIYLPDTGFVIQSRKIHSRYESPEFVRKLSIVDAKRGRDHYNFFINDPGKSFGPKYISFMGGVALIPVIEDYDNLPGLYYDILDSDGVKRQKFMGSDEVMNTVFLRPSYEEGLKGASIEEINKRKLEEMKIRNEERKEEHERQKRAFDFLENGRKFKRDELRWHQTQAAEKPTRTDEFLNAFKTFASVMAVTAGIITTLYKLAN